MRKIYAIFLAVSIAAGTFAQAPQKMSYQAVIRNSAGVLVQHSKVGLKISLLQGSVSGTEVYAETQNTETNDNGLVTIEIGGGTPVTGTFAGINWANGPYFIKTETDPTGGTGYTITGTSELLSVPYALYAKTASAHYVGESYGGGIVFYVYDNGQHGLIAATADQSTSSTWYNGVYTSTNAVRDGINAGKFNTERIIISQGIGSYAAQICANNQDGNYGDWYLPSKFELNLLYLQKSVVGGFATDFYWSSTEDNSNSDKAWTQSFSNGSQGSDNINKFFYVRAIRAF